MKMENVETVSFHQNFLESSAPNIFEQIKLMKKDIFIELIIYLRTL